MTTGLLHMAIDFLGSSPEVANRISFTDGPALFLNNYLDWLYDCLYSLHSTLISSWPCRECLPRKLYDILAIPMSDCAFSLSLCQLKFSKRFHFRLFYDHRPPPPPPTWTIAQMYIVQCTLYGHMVTFSLLTTHTNCSVYKFSYVLPKTLSGRFLNGPSGGGFTSLVESRIGLGWEGGRLMVGGGCVLRSCTRIEHISLWTRIERDLDCTLEGIIKLERGSLKCVCVCARHTWIICDTPWTNLKAFPSRRRDAKGRQIFLNDRRSSQKAVYEDYISFRVWRIDNLLPSCVLSNLKIVSFEKSICKVDIFAHCSPFLFHLL